MLNKTQIKFIESICKKYKNDFIIVFGSYAKNKKRVTSDIDLAYYSIDEVNYQELFVEFIEKFKGKDIDLINISQDKPIRLRQIIFR